MSTFSESTFASFGKSLKIFHFEKGKFYETAEYIGGYSNEDTSTGNQISWAGDAQWLVGPVEEKNILPVFKYESSNSSKKITRMRHITEADVTAAAYYSLTNSRIVVGSKSGAVKIFNVRDKKVQKTLCSKGTLPVKFLNVSLDDGHAASAGSFSDNPTVQVFGLTTGTLVNSLKLDEAAEISDLRFSPIRKNYLGCSTVEGSVVVWDIYKGVTIMEQSKAHASACTGFALSPTNSNVAASVGLSNSLLIHDVRKRMAVLKVEVEARLTAVDLMREPYAILGSRNGRILLLDLRNSQVVQEELSHEGPVHSVRCADRQPTVRQFEDAAVNTPDEPITVVKPLEMSVADICTPPAPLTQLQHSALGKLIGNQELISPISPGVVRRLTHHSTPITTEYADSFLNLLVSPAVSSAAPPSFNISPSPLVFPGPNITLTALSNLKNNQEHVCEGDLVANARTENISNGGSITSTTPTPKSNNFFSSEPNKVVENGGLCKNDISQMREEIKALRKEVLLGKDIKEEIIAVREQLACLPFLLEEVKVIREEQEAAKVIYTEIQAMQKRNHNAMMQLHSDFELLEFEIRYDRAISKQNGQN